MSKLVSLLRTVVRHSTVTTIRNTESAQIPLQSVAPWLSSYIPRWSTTAAAPPGESSKEPVSEDPFAHATGLERAELEAQAKGMSLLDEEWLNAPFGTIEKPAVVPSIHAERIVGVPDPHDDCIITWGVIREGEPPKQLVEDGEYFVLKRIPVPDWAPES
eukprot:g4572.t1